MFKKILIGLSVFAVLVMGTLIAIPFFYNIDSLRPKIIEAAEKSLRGKVSIDKISLGLFPKIRVGVYNVALTSPAQFSQDKNPFIKIDSVELEMPLSSLITAPTASLTINAPKITLVSKGSSSNLSEFLPAPNPETAKQETAGQSASGEEQGPPKAVGQILSELPPWLAQRILAARFYFQIQGAAAEIVALDGPKDDVLKVDELSVSLSDIGLRAPMKISTALNVFVQKGRDTLVKGLIKTSGELTLNPEGDNNNVGLKFLADLAGLDVKSGILFHKPSGTALGASIDANIVQNPKLVVVKMNALDLRFANVELKSTLSLEKPAEPTNPGKFEMQMSAQKIDLAPFGTFIAPVKQFGLGGQASLDLKAQGALNDPNINMVMTLSNIKGSTPQLKHGIEKLNGRIQISGNAKKPIVSVDPFSLKIASSDLALSFKSEGIDPINLKASVQSKLLNVDELLGLPTPGSAEFVAAKAKADAESKAAQEAAKVAAKNAPKTPPVPLDEALDKLAPTVEEALKNPMLDKLFANFSMKLGDIRVVGARYTNATLNVNYGKRKLTVNKTGIGAYDGQMTVDVGLDLNPKAFGYNFGFDLKGVKLGEMTRAHAPEWQGVATGTVVSNGRITGKGLRREQLNEFLAGNFSGEVKNGKTNFPLNKIMSKIVAGLPAQLKEKAGKEVDDKEFSGDFSTMKMAGSIKGRTVRLDDLDIQFTDSGSKLKDIRFKANGTVNFDQQIDFLGTTFVSPDVVRISELKGPTGKVELPVKVKGTMVDPQPDVGYTVGIVGPRILAEAAKSKAAEALKEEAKKALEKAGIKPEQLKPENLPPPAQKAVEDLKKKFKF